MAADSSATPDAGAGPGASPQPEPSPPPAAAKEKKAGSVGVVGLLIRLAVFLVVLGGLWVWLVTIRSGQWGTEKTVYFSALILEGILLAWLFFEVYVLDVFQSPPTTPGPETNEDRKRTRAWSEARFVRRKWLKRLFTALIMILLVTLWFRAVRQHFEDWGWGKTLFFSIPFIVALVVAFLLHKVMRARDTIAEDWVRSNPDDPTCENVLVVFNLSKKVLYFTTILASLVMAVLVYLVQEHGLDVSQRLLGGIWLAIFFLNFLVEEYEVDLMAVVVGLAVILATVVWVAYMGWTQEFVDFFENFGVSIDSTGYLLIAAVFALAIFYSIVKGAFYYVAITPNDINVQMGLTESGRQINRDAFTTTVDTGDLMERIFGFGRIIVTFRDPTFKPMEMLVWNIKGKAEKLEAIRATYVVDDRQRL
jgi:hypothetical protein